MAVPPPGSELEELYQEIVNSGFGTAQPLPWFTVQGMRPDLLRATWGLLRAVMVSGWLPPTLKQMVLAVISNRSGAQRNAVAQAGALEALGVPSALIESCANDPDLAGIPEPQRTILQFAAQAASAPEAVSDEDIDGLRSVLDDGEIAELMTLVATNAFVDTLADLTGVS